MKAHQLVTLLQEVDPNCEITFIHTAETWAPAGLKSVEVRNVFNGVSLSKYGQEAELVLNFYDRQLIIVGKKP